jgi:hypothetical protein
LNFGLIQDTLHNSATPNHRNLRVPERFVKGNNTIFVRLENKTRDDRTNSNFAPGFVLGDDPGPDGSDWKDAHQKKN